MTGSQGSLRSLGTGALALLFAASVAVQWNDPDPLRWMALYGAAAAVAATSLVRPVPRAISIGIGAVALVWAVLWLPEVLSLAAFTGNEEERELGGLLIVVAAMAWLARGPAPPIAHTASCKLADRLRRLRQK